jgi:cytochrome c biogenesis factor
MLKTLRVIVALSAVAFVGAGVVSAVMPVRHDRALAVALGVLMILIGMGEGLWAWRGRWRVATVEEHERHVERMKVVDAGVNGFDLLLLALVLAGLLWPGRFGEFAETHRGAFWFALAGVGLGAVLRVAQRVNARRTRRRAEVSNDG